MTPRALLAALLAALLLGACSGAASGGAGTGAGRSLRQQLAAEAPQPAPAELAPSPAPSPAGAGAEPELGKQPEPSDAPGDGVAGDAGPSAGPTDPNAAFIDGGAAGPADTAGNPLSAGPGGDAAGGDGGVSSAPDVLEPLRQDGPAAGDAAAAGGGPAAPLDTPAEAAGGDPAAAAAQGDPASSPSAGPGQGDGGVAGGDGGVFSQSLETAGGVGPGGADAPKAPSPAPAPSPPPAPLAKQPASPPPPGKAKVDAAAVVAPPPEGASAAAVQDSTLPPAEQPAASPQPDGGGKVPATATPAPPPPPPSPPPRKSPPPPRKAPPGDQVGSAAVGDDPLNPNSPLDPPLSPGLSPDAFSPSPDPPSPEPLSPEPLPPAPAPPVPVNDQALALLAFKAGLTNGDKVLASWTAPTDNPCGPPGWQGVICNQAGTAVTELVLPGQELQGPISSSLGQLNALTLLNLSDNQLSGGVPALELRRLEQLILHSNRLEGPLPSLDGLPALFSASLYDNKLTGPIPASWSSLSGNTTIIAAPNELCGAVPRQGSGPALLFASTEGVYHPMVNTLGSCFAACDNPSQNLAGSSLFEVALINRATAWDAAHVNGWTAWTPATGSQAEMPCYMPGSPAGGYKGGDQAYLMMAWNDEGSALAGSVVSEMPGQSPSCNKQGLLWGVDLRYPMQISQIIIDSQDSITGLTVTVSNGTTPQGGGAVDCITDLTTTATGSIVTTVVACAATGRYVMLWVQPSPDPISQPELPMDLCRVSVYPEVADASFNSQWQATTASGELQTGAWSGNAMTVVAPSGQDPMFVLDIGGQAAVAAVSLGPPSALSTPATVRVSTTNPLAAGRRRLAQAADPAAPAQQAPEELQGGLPSLTGGGVNCATDPLSPNSYQCAAARGQYIVLSGFQESPMAIAGLSVYLAQPPILLPPPPPPPPPGPPPSPYQQLWVANLLLGGTIGSFAPTAQNNATLLTVYNSAWTSALAASGLGMDPSATQLLSLQNNASNLAGPPFYYAGAAPAGGNLATNTSVSVSKRGLDENGLYDLLNTPAVQDAIAAGLQDAGYGTVSVQMAPYTPPPSPDSGGSGLSTGAIAGIAAGAAVLLLAAAVLLFVWCRPAARRARQDSAKQHASIEEGLGAGAGPAGPPGKAPSSTQLAQAQQLFQQEQQQQFMASSGGGLLYGSAYGNGALTGKGGAAAVAGAAAGAAAAASLAASGRQHSRSASGVDEDSAGMASDSTRRMLSNDPLLEWILKTQSPATEEGEALARAASAAAVAAEERQLAAAAAGLAMPDREASAPGGGDASTAPGTPGTPASSVAASGVSAMTGTPRTRRVSGSKSGLDVRVWQFDFRDLEIQKQIGEGSFGRVYLAKWRETLVAVKILMNTGVDIEDEEGAERALTLSNPVLESLEKEASMMAAMRHPNVVGFLGVCATPPCVATEYCGRGSLTDVLRGGKNSPAKAKLLDWARRLNMALDAAKGMHYLHEHVPPILHRDLKSPNLLVDKHWRVKVSDFNLSKLMDESAVMSSMAATNPRWLSPEILKGEKAAFEADVYAFGVVLWEILTWELPWGATNPWTVVTIVTEGGRLEFPPRERLPGPDTMTWPELDAYLRLTQRCWAQEPADRPKFKEVIAELRDMLERTLAARGSLPAVHGSPAADSTGLRTAGGSNASTAMAAASGISGMGASTAAGGASTSAAAAAANTILPRPSPPASPLPGVPLSPSLGARGRLDSGVGTSGSGAQTPPSGYSSMAAEAGSPRRDLDSAPRP